LFWVEVGILFSIQIEYCIIKRLVHEAFKAKIEELREKLETTSKQFEELVKEAKHEMTRAETYKYLNRIAAKEFKHQMNCEAKSGKHEYFLRIKFKEFMAKEAEHQMNWEEKAKNFRYEFKELVKQAKHEMTSEAETFEYSNHISSSSSSSSEDEEYREFKNLYDETEFAEYLNYLGRLEEFIKKQYKNEMNWKTESLLMSFLKDRDTFAYGF